MLFCCHSAEAAEEKAIITFRFAGSVYQSIYVPGATVCLIKWPGWYEMSATPYVCTRVDSERRFIVELPVPSSWFVRVRRDDPLLKTMHVSSVGFTITKSNDRQEILIPEMFSEISYDPASD